MPPIPVAQLGEGILSEPQSLADLIGVFNWLHAKGDPRAQEVGALIQEWGVNAPAARYAGGNRTQIPLRAPVRNAFAR